jgi:membrane-bound serine protease (ClpP class)
VGIAVVLFLLILKLLPKDGPWGRLILESAVAGEPGPLRALNVPDSGEAPPSSSLVGCKGVAVTSLFPSGQVEIDGKRYEAKLAMGFAEAGTAVTVTGTSEFSLIVEALS